MDSRAATTFAGSVPSGSTRLSGIGPTQISSGSGSPGSVARPEPAGREVHRPGPPLRAAEHVQADVRRDPVQPGPQRRAALEPVEAAPGPHEACPARRPRPRRPSPASGSSSRSAPTGTPPAATRSGRGRHVAHPDEPTRSRRPMNSRRPRRSTPGGTVPEGTNTHDNERHPPRMARAGRAGAAHAAAVDRRQRPVPRAAAPGHEPAAPTARSSCGSWTSTRSCWPASWSRWARSATGSAGAGCC